jgi:hypothetical protein
MYELRCCVEWSMMHCAHLSTLSSWAGLVVCSVPLERLKRQLTRRRCQLPKCSKTLLHVSGQCPLSRHCSTLSQMRISRRVCKLASSIKASSFRRLASMRRCVVEQGLCIASGTQLRPCNVTCLHAQANIRIAGLVVQSGATTTDVRQQHIFCCSCETRAYNKLFHFTPLVRHMPTSQVAPLLPARKRWCGQARFDQARFRWLWCSRALDRCRLLRVSRRWFCRALLVAHRGFSWTARVQACPTVFKAVAARCRSASAVYARAPGR